MFNVERLESEISRLKLDLIQVAEDNEDLQSKKVINKSQELDELIVSYMKDRCSN